MTQAVCNEGISINTKETALPHLIQTPFTDEGRSTMQTIRIRKVAVLGSGVMGAQIAAHLSNARVPVILFDLPSKDGKKNNIAQQAITKLTKQSPAPLGLNSDVQYIQAANYEDDLECLRECDLVIEAIAERLDWKQALYQKIVPYLAPQAILATNTSGLSIQSLASQLTAELKTRFCGVHFFNPPRYMHLLELIPIAETQPNLLNALETFMTQTLGKGVIRAKDTPNFIANRVGVFAILAVFIHAQKYGLSYDLVDDLTGKRLDRAKSATFRTADVVGLDVLAHVIGTMQQGLADDSFRQAYQIPEALAELIKQGALGQKTGAGFYRKVGKQIQVFDPKNNAYIVSEVQADALITRILKRPLHERLKLLRETDHPQAQFLWAVFRDLFHYVAVHLGDIADNARDLDLALRWGFGWERGPFEEWQAAGWQQVTQWLQADIQAGHTLSQAPLPAWVTAGPVALGAGVHQEAGSWSVNEQRFIARSQLPVYQQHIFPPHLLIQRDAKTVQFPDQNTIGKVVIENDAAKIWTAHDEDVLILSFKSKMNTISPDVIAAIHQAIDLAERHYAALVIWQPTSLVLGTPGGPFSAGANLEVAMPLFMQGGAKALNSIVEGFQKMTMRVKYAQVPVVSAISGIALGGGCELIMHSAKRVAAFESYIGLVEAGVGLLPAGGGLKEIAIRAANDAQRIGSRNYIDFMKNYFQNAAMAKVSGSALEAKAMGYLLPNDPIVFNVHALLHTAIGEARQMALSGWRPPLPQRVAVAGRSGIAAFKLQLLNLYEGQFISAHDMLIAQRIAEIVCGGEVDAGTLVDEDWLLALERRAFIELLGTQKTQERIMGMLQTGKPVRN